MQQRAKSGVSGESMGSSLAKVPLFAVLDAEERGRLAELMMSRRLVKGQPVFLQGDPGDEMYLLLEGRVRICCESLSGREVTLAIFNDGGFFGEMALLDGQARSATAISESACRLLVLRRADFQTFLRSCPNAAIALLAFLSQRLRVANEKIQDLALLTVRQRLAAMLVDLACKEGESTEDGVLLYPTVSHKLLSGLLGTSRETVSRMCAELKELDLVAQQGRRLLVRNIAGLREICAEAGVR